MIGKGLELREIGVNRVTLGEFEQSTSGVVILRRNKACL